MKAIGITGAGGQLGTYACARLQYHHQMAVHPADRAVMSSPSMLQAICAQSDVVVHLAGVNRGTDAEVAEGNPRLAQDLVTACHAAGKAPQIIFASSIHRDGSSLYGQAKAAASDILKSFCAESGAPYAEIVFPNLFGEFTRPFYNSFVGTFCHQTAKGETPTVNADAPIDLMHYRDAADAIADAIANPETGVVRPKGVSTSVGAVAAKLAAFEADYATGVIPDLRQEFDLQLFNTYRSYLYPARYPIMLVRHADQRGSFFECVRERNGGQTSFSTTRPGITRGNHFHFDKIERFLVLAGKARISIRKLYTDEVVHFDVDGERPCAIDMPTLHTHNITNTGPGELVTLFWSHDLFDPAKPDTYVEAV